MTITKLNESPFLSRVSAKMSASQPIAAGTSRTKVAFDTDSGSANLFDTNSEFDTSNNRFTAKKDIFIIINFQIAYVLNSSGVRVAYIYKNGAEHRYKEKTGNSTIGVCVGFSFLAYLARGEYIEIFTKQTSGGSLNISNNNRSFLTITE